MEKTTHIGGILGLLLIRSASLPAQPESTDFMRSTGKIWVVVAVIAAVFLGIVLFLVYLDRKLTRIENQIKEHEQTDA